MGSQVSEVSGFLPQTVNPTLGQGLFNFAQTTTRISPD
jgi:hypothetical protein